MEHIAPVFDHVASLLICIDIGSHLCVKCHHAAVTTISKAPPACNHVWCRIQRLRAAPLDLPQR